MVNLHTHDHRTRDLGTVVLSLRDDLIFSPRSISGESCYVLEDPVNSKFYSIGIAEYSFLSCLDGNTTVANALSLIARTQPNRALTEHEVAAVCRWLIENDLASTAASRTDGGLAKPADTEHAARWQKWHPLYTKIPLCFPDRLFDKLTPWMRGLFSVPAFVVALVLALVATFNVCVQWDRFFAATACVLSPSRWTLLALCWLCLKILHEISHGVVCKKYRGSVHEAGAIFVLLAPLAYVDVTSSWRFRSKWQRIFTAAAGMYFEIIIASIAALVWARTAPGILNDICFNVVFMAGIATLVFNANPLMRFDGYYILADLIDIPNLYTDGQSFARDLCRRHLLGMSGKPSTGSPSRDMFILCYGIASFCWRQFITLGLILVAATMFDGAGIIIAAVAAVMWIVVPVTQFGMNACFGTEWDSARRIRCALVVVPIVLMLSYAANTIPWPGIIRAPAIVDYSPLSIVRAGSSGFVRHIYVSSGRSVEKGQLVAKLENDELTSELHDLALSILQSKLRARGFEQREELAAYQAESKQLDSLEIKHREKQREVAQLSIVAPCSGRVILRNAKSLLGTYATVGTEIVSIGHENRKELRIAIRQDDVQAFRGSLGADIDVRLPGIGRLKCELVRLNPRASVEPSHPSLCASFGGPLNVRERPRSETNGTEHTFELLSPRFRGIVGLSETESSQLRVGQRGVAWLANGNESIAEHLIRKVKDQFSKVLRQDVASRPQHRHGTTTNSNQTGSMNPRTPPSIGCTRRREA